MNLVQTFLLLGAINGFVIGITLLSIKNGNRTATQIYGVIVLLLGMMIFEEFLQFNLLQFKYPHLMSLGDGLLLIIAPLVYLYTLFILEKKRQLVLKDLLHGFPFLLFTLVMMPFYLQSGAYKLANTNYDTTGFISLTKGLIAFSYFILSLYLVIRISKQKNKEDFPINNLRNIIWHKRLLISIILIAISALFLDSLWNSGIEMELDPDTISALFTSLLVYINSIILIRNPFLLWNVPDFSKKENEYIDIKIKNTKKYKNSPLTDDDLKSNIDTLMEVMDKEKPYLNPNLTPRDLELLTKIKVYYLSQTLSEVLNKNFSEFVNAYRVKEAKRLLLDPAKNKENVLSIGFESGFNSKSSFNRVFKQHTGKTPSQFRASPNGSGVKK